MFTIQGLGGGRGGGEDLAPASADDSAPAPPPGPPRLSREEAAHRFPPPPLDVLRTWFPGLERSGTGFLAGTPPAGTPPKKVRMRLVCFSNAGSAEDMYTSEGTGTRRVASPLLDWARASGVEVLAPQLPGRNARGKEPFLRTPQSIAAALLPLLGARLADPEVPYAILAHSVGTWVAFEFLSLLREAGLPMPAHVLFSAFPAPDIAPAARPWRPNAALNEAAFKGELAPGNYIHCMHLMGTGRTALYTCVSAA